MIFVYDAGATDFTNNGLGALKPENCLVTEEINGEYSLTLVHPIDETGKWRRLRMGNIIKAPVPAGKTPRINTGGMDQTETEIWMVNTGEGNTLYNTLDHENHFSSYGATQKLIMNTDQTISNSKFGKTYGYQSSYRAFVFEDVRFLGSNSALKFERDAGGKISGVSIPILYKRISTIDNNF